MSLTLQKYPSKSEEKVEVVKTRAGVLNALEKRSRFHSNGFVPWTIYFSVLEEDFWIKELGLILRCNIFYFGKVRVEFRGLLQPSDMLLFFYPVKEHGEVIHDYCMLIPPYSSISS